MRRKQGAKLKAFISLLISLQMAAGPELAMASGARTPTGNGSGQANGVDIARAQQNDDPIWQQFVDAKPTSDAFQLHFSPEDPAIDRDPYFLRSQSWLKGSASSSLSDSSKVSTAPFFRKIGSSVEIAIPGARRALRLSAPLTPIHATDDFIFLSVDKGADLFKKAAGEEAPGEGLFFISREDLVNRALQSQPVPVYFLPLPGQGWTGKIDAHEVPELGILAIANSENTAIALELKDVETMMKGQQFNLTLALSVSVKDRGAGDEALVLPAPGTTAAFGLFFTGLNLENPARSVWQVSANNSNELIAKWLTAAFTKVPILKTLLPKEAQAFDLPPAVAARVMFVGAVLTGMLATSFIIKYAHPGIRRKIKSLRTGEEPKGIAGKLRREGKEIMDVFAHMTTTSSQIAIVTFANSLEIFLDRFAPSVAAADHTLIRRFLNRTYFFSRNLVKKAPVNAKTFFLGAIVMGTVDTALVVWQYVSLIPWMAEKSAPYLNDAWREKVEHTFDPNNPNTKGIVIQDSVRNGLAHLQSGASGYAMDSRAQVIETIEREVDAALRAQGKDPLAPAVQTERQNLIDEKADLVLQQRGLPGKDQHLFDASSIYSFLPTVLGYRAPEDLQAKESFILSTRFGLSKNALERALNVARENAKTDASQAAREVVAILEETAGSMSFLRGAVTQGAEGLKAARAVRQQLTLLSYEGPVDWAVQYIPDAWTARFSPEAARTAGLLFRQSLYSFLSRDGMALLKPSEKDQRDFGTKARQEALNKIVKERSELASLPKTEAEKVIVNAHAFELNVRTQMEIGSLAREHAKDVEALGYKPPKMDWLARRQHARAERYANERLAIQSSEQALQDADTQKLWKRYYRDALAKEVGLSLERPAAAPQPTEIDQEKSLRFLLDRKGNVEYERMLAYVESQADSTTEGELTHDKGLAAYLEKADPVERLKIEAAHYATNFLQSYKEATTEREMIAPLDPQQPGRFQKIRQSSWVSRSPAVVRTLRAIESLVNDQDLTVGWKGRLSRNVPLFSDLLASHQRLVKTILPGMTIGYAYSYFAWQVHIPYATWGLFIATSAATIVTPSQWLSRAFRMNGLKPMDTVWSKTMYALPYGMVTFLGMIPMTIFSPDVNRAFADYVRDPFMSVLGQIPFDRWMEAGVAAGLVVATKKIADVVKKARNKRENEGAAFPTALTARTRGAVLTCDGLFAR